MKPLLSICIPTYNRERYLGEILAMLGPQLEGKAAAKTELVVIDNASTDSTPQTLAGFAAKHPAARCLRNETNIGGDRNFLRCIREAKGEYVWLVGDDDLVHEGAVAKTLALLEEHAPALLIAAEHQRDGVAVYDNYRECLLHEKSPSGDFAIDHTLITANIFRRGLFDLDFAEATLHLSYAHMFGLMKNLKSGKVVVASALISERPVRAEFAKYPSFLCIKQAIYLRFLAKTFDLPRLRFRAILKALNLPMEFGSRIKFHLKKLFAK